MPCAPSPGLRGPTGATVPVRLGEFGIVVPKGVHYIERLLALAEAAELPENARLPVRLLAGQFRDTKSRIDEVTTEIRTLAEADATAIRLQTIPGIGPIIASVLAATLPSASEFQSSRDLAAWIGLTPKPYSSGGKERLGRISKMGNRYIRRLLYLGAMAQITARRRQEQSGDWLGKLIARKPLKDEPSVQGQWRMPSPWPAAWLEWSGYS